MNKLGSKMGLGFSPIGIGSMMLGGLRNLNDRIQSSDFGQATSLADYLDMQRYGGASAAAQSDAAAGMGGY